MMKRIVFSSAFAGVLAMGAGGVMAQSPGMAGSQARTPAVTSADQDEHQVTIEGCIAREQDVAGREPGFMERMGIGTDFLLTDARLASDVDARVEPRAAGDASAAASAAADSAEDTAENAAESAEATAEDAADAVAGRSDSAQDADQAGSQGRLYELEGIDDDELQRYVGQRVEIQGTLEDLDEIDVAGDDLPELNVESIRPASSGGSCAQ